MLVERIRAAIVAVEGAGSLEHRRARVAAQHLEFELGPFVEQLNLQRVTDELVSAAIDEYNRQNGQKRLAFGIVSGRRCPPTEVVDVSSTVLPVPSRIEHLEIAEHLAPSFVIHEIIFGGTLQYPRPDGRRGAARRAPLPATTFAPSSRVPRPITFDVQRHGEPIVVLRVEYRGHDPKGEAFMATAHCLTRDADRGVHNDPLARG